MLSTITLLTCLIVAVLYPLCFWLSAQNPLKNNFHHFHLGLPTVLAGLVLPFIWMGEFELFTKTFALIWFAGLLALGFYYWHKEFPRPFIVTQVVLIGILTFIQVQGSALHIIHPFNIWTLSLVGLLAGLILCAVLYAMNLGHWYLNVHGLPIKYLSQATNIFVVLLILRLLFDFYAVLTEQVFYLSESWPLSRFIFKMDGVFIWLAFFFGTIFPLVSTYFVYGTLKLKNTQSATGILYVILAAVLLGDLTYKYYLIKYGIVL